ncbi:hypothetical protein Vretimale_16028 [Volvox reticuliferus]|uniref:Uncharacterized protein n=1 Tax=Volvox reticuliferus TaxID=1737510 RepID=A0A8J4GS09_9CHLO|nr:hypothetical protein Vretimale_16028 [Volvox reticuliferus]
MKHVAVLSLACAIWLANKRRRNSTLLKSVTSEFPPAVNHSSAYVMPSAEAHEHIPAAQVSYAPAAATTDPAPSTPRTGVMLQRIFLILLSVALCLTAAKGSWDVFALLVAAAVVQLGIQRVCWLRSDSEGSGGCPGRKSCMSVGAMAALRPRGAAALMAPAQLLVPDQRLGGVWVKDPTRSDSMDEATSAMRLNGIVRTAIRLIRGLELDPEALKAGRSARATCWMGQWHPTTGEICGRGSTLLLSPYSQMDPSCYQ